MNMEILKSLAELKNSILDFVFPAHCLLCNTSLSSERGNLQESNPSFLVCQDCWKSLNILPHPFCPLCRAFLDFSQISSGKPRRCPKCPESSLMLNRSLGLFDPYYQILIHNFKYKRKITLGEMLGRRLGEILKEERVLEEIDYLIPVPLHSSRERERGYNQSKVLAQEISEITGLSLLDKILIRKKNTKDQTNLSLEQRERNVKDAFTVRNNTVLKGKGVLLVDDVMTTGATLRECSRALKEAGARTVIGTTIVVVN
jgi:competence protein ComFC